MFITPSQLTLREQTILDEVMRAPVEDSLRYKYGTRAAIMGITMAQNVMLKKPVTYSVAATSITTN